MEITLLEDPGCPWCWAFQPVMTALEYEFPGAPGRRPIVFRRVMGGLSDRPVVEASFAVRQWEEAARLSGMPFRIAIWSKHLLRTTYEACRIVKAATPIGTSAVSRLLRRIRESFFTEGGHIDRREDLLGLAAEEGLDVEVLRENLSNRRADLLFDRDRQEANGSRFGFPTLLLRKHPTDLPAVLHGMVSYTEVLQTLYRIGLSPRERRRFAGEPWDWDRLFSVHRRLARAEISLITGLEGEALEAACAPWCRAEGDLLMRGEPADRPAEAEAAQEPAPQEAVTAPELLEAAPVPDLQEAAAAPELQEAATVPDLQEAAIAPDLQEAATVPDLQEAAAAPVLHEAAPPAADAETMVVPAAAAAGSAHEIAV